MPAGSRKRATRRAPDRPAVEHDGETRRIFRHRRILVEAFPQRAHVAPRRLGRIEPRRGALFRKNLFEHVAHGLGCRWLSDGSIRGA